VAARKAGPAKFGPEDAAIGVPGRDRPAAPEHEDPVQPEDQPEQAGGPVTGAENIERQQKDPDLKDSTGAHP
jgi:hypothetical protein